MKPAARYRAQLILLACETGRGAYYGQRWEVSNAVVRPGPGSSADVTGAWTHQLEIRTPCDVGPPGALPVTGGVIPSSRLPAAARGP